MTATDELRRMLDERRVKWEDMSIFPLACTSWHDHDSEPCTALEGTDDIPDGKVSVQACVTPAQAIAATLGPDARHQKPHEQWTTVLLPEIAWDCGDRWPDYLSVAHDAHDEWRVYVPEATLGPGTLTAEQVSNATYAHSIHADCADADWQAIADELNATLGPGTCHQIISDNLAESEGTGDAWADCSECGHLLFVLTDPTSEPPNFCPNCGRRVVEVDDG